MNLILLTATGILAVLGVAFFLLFRSLASRQNSAPVASDWENIFSPDRYRPMERLLDPADYRFLASQSGYSRWLGRNLRTQRKRIFRGYARCLSRDFTRVCSAIKMLMVHSQTDRSALASMLLKQRLLFTCALISVEFRLMLHGLSLGAAPVNVRNLIESLDTMRTQLRALALVAQPAAA